MANSVRYVAVCEGAGENFERQGCRVGGGVDEGGFGEEGGPG